MSCYSVSKIVMFPNQILKQCVSSYFKHKNDQIRFNSEVMCQIGFGSFSIRVCQWSFIDSDNQQNQYS